MALDTLTKEDLGFKFELKRFKKSKVLPPICPDYQPNSSSSNFCTLAEKCKNATQPPAEYGDLAFCQGGTDPKEIKRRKERFQLEKVK